MVSTTPQSAAGATPNLPLVHRVLVLGLATVAGLFAYLLFGVTGPLLEPGGVVGPVTGFAGLSMVAMAVMIFRPRVLRRSAGQSTGEYWAEVANSGPALLLWAMVEAGGMMGLTGWLISGSLVALAAGLVGLGVLIVLSPGQLAGK